MDTDELYNVIIKIHDGEQKIGDILRGLKGKRLTGQQIDLIVYALLENEGTFEDVYLFLSTINGSIANACNKMIYQCMHAGDPSLLGKFYLLKYRMA